MQMSVFIGRMVWAIPATVAILAVWVVSAAANWHFGASLGTSAPFDALLFQTTTARLFSSASLSSDVLKMVMLFAATTAVAVGMWRAAIVTGFIWLACMTWSVASAVGFVALNHATVTDQRGKGEVEWAQLSKEIERLEKRRAWIPHHRPLATVSADIAQKEGAYLFQRSKSCADITTSESRAFCEGLGQLRREQANAQEAAKLDAKLSGLRQETKKTDRVTTVDPFAALVASLSAGVKANGVSTGRAIFLALMLELISGPGLWAVWSAALSGPRKPKEARTAPVPVLDVNPPAKPVQAAIEAPSKPQVPKRAKRGGKPKLVVDNREPKASAPEGADDDAHIDAWLASETEKTGHAWQGTPAKGQDGAHAAYVKWCEANGYAWKNASYFGRAMAARAVKKWRTGKGAVYGLRLKKEGGKIAAAL